MTVRWLCSQVSNTCNDFGTLGLFPVTQLLKQKLCNISTYLPDIKLFSYAYVWFAILLPNKTTHKQRPFYWTKLPKIIWLCVTTNISYTMIKTIKICILSLVNQKFRPQIIYINQSEMLAEWNTVTTSSCFSLWTSLLIYEYKFGYVFRYWLPYVFLTDLCTFDRNIWLTWDKI